MLASGEPAGRTLGGLDVVVQQHRYHPGKHIGFHLAGGVLVQLGGLAVGLGRTRLA